MKFEHRSIQNSLLHQNIINFGFNLISFETQLISRDLKGQDITLISFQMSLLDGLVEGGKSYRVR
jgi:hypothetical protein